MDAETASNKLISVTADGFEATRLCHFLSQQGLISARFSFHVVNSIDFCGNATNGFALSSPEFVGVFTLSTLGSIPLHPGDRAESSKSINTCQCSYYVCVFVPVSVCVCVNTLQSSISRECLSLRNCSVSLKGDGRY